MTLPLERLSALLARLAPFRFGNVSEGRMILDKDERYFCFVHVEQAGGGSIGSVVEDMRRKSADDLLAMLNTLPALIARVNELEAALESADEALCEYACHGGPDVPCIRSEDQCWGSFCGKAAGDALVKVKAARHAITGSTHD